MPFATILTAVGTAVGAFGVLVLIVGVVVVGFLDDAEPRPRLQNGPLAAHR